MKLHIENDDDWFAQVFARLVLDAMSADITKLREENERVRGHNTLLRAAAEDLTVEPTLSPIEEGKWVLVPKEARDYLKEWLEETAAKS